MGRAEEEVEGWLWGGCLGEGLCGLKDDLNMSLDYYLGKIRGQLNLFRCEMRTWIGEDGRIDKGVLQ